MTSSPAGDGRSLDRLRAHYEVERELADRLRLAPRAERLALYASAYDELYQRVPDHPQLSARQDPQARQRDVAGQMRLLGRFLKPGMRLIEIGPGDCSLSIHACRVASEVLAVDVSAEITRRSDLPANLSLRLSDGVSVPHPEGGVDVVYSHQLMEHLHPDDARAQLAQVLQALAPGGVYVCVTPNRLMGPHDVSRYFSDRAQGFHLQEYTGTELLALLRAVGFARVVVWVSVHGHYLPLPAPLLHACEWLLGRAGPVWRQRLARWPPCRWLATLCVVGQR